MSLNETLFLAGHHSGVNSVLSPCAVSSKKQGGRKHTRGRRVQAQSARGAEQNPWGEQQRAKIRALAVFCFTCELVDVACP